MHTTSESRRHSVARCSKSQGGEAGLCHYAHLLYHRSLANHRDYFCPSCLHNRENGGKPKVKVAQAEVLEHLPLGLGQTDGDDQVELEKREIYSKIDANSQSNAPSFVPVIWRVAGFHIDYRYSRNKLESDK